MFEINDYSRQNPAYRFAYSIIGYIKVKGTLYDCVLLHIGEKYDIIIMIQISEDI